MRNITMCQNKCCPAKENCLRFVSVPAPLQVYADFRPTEDGEECDEFISIPKAEAAR